MATCHVIQGNPSANLREQESGLIGQSGEKENVGVGGDLGSIEKMTVQELRGKLRSVGIPAKGSKVQLVCAWKNYLNNQAKGVEDHAYCESDLMEGTNSNNVPSMDNNLETAVNKKARKRVKEGSDGDKKVETRINSRKIKGSSIYVEVTGKGSSMAKRKISSEEVCTISETFEAVVSSEEPWTVLAHKKPQIGWIAYNPRTMRPPPLTRDVKQVKLMSWNVNGLRALLKLEGFSALELAKREDFDVLCFQETKLQEKDVESVKQSLIQGYDNSFWTCSVSKLGYSGTAIVSRIEPLSVRYGLGIPDHDTEGRLVTVEFDKFYLLSGYVPNSGDGLKRLDYRLSHWDPSLGNHMKELEKSKPVILTGDLNCAHEEIDIYDPAGNKRSAGFTAEERQSFETNFLNKGFVDTFRRQHPGVVGYTYWGYRHGGRKTNKGWRLDYFLASEAIADNVHDSYILPDVNGSDHCPIGLIMKL